MIDIYIDFLKYVIYNILQAEVVFGKVPASKWEILNSGEPPANKWEIN